MYKNYDLDEFDTSLRYDFDISLSEFLELLNLYNELKDDCKKYLLKSYETGYNKHKFEQINNFEKKCKEKYNIYLDDFMHIYLLFDELSEEAKLEATKKHP